MGDLTVSVCVCVCTCLQEYQYQWSLEGRSQQISTRLGTPMPVGMLWRDSRLNPRPGQAVSWGLHGKAVSRKCTSSQPRPIASSSNTLVCQGYTEAKPRWPPPILYTAPADKESRATAAA